MEGEPAPDLGEDIMAKLEDIEGIGPVYAEKLRGAGIRSVEALTKAGATPAGRKEIAAKSGLSDSKVLEWVNHADLFRIKGVAEEYADLLEAAGVGTVKELGEWDPATLLTALVQTNRSKKLVRRLATQAQVADWVRQAKRLTYPLAEFSKFAIDTEITDLAERHHHHIARGLKVTYDGEVLHLQEPIDLEPNKTYRITIEEDAEQPDADEMPEVFRRILARARDLGVGDLAEQHDHYLYGTPKR
jgi:predicted flap endonuclease-1-like 5' DNA nuclease